MHQHVRQEQLSEQPYWMSQQPLRSEVFRVYRALYHIGKEYPKGSLWFHNKLKAAFWKNKDETDPEKIKALIARGDFVVKEIETLYYLRKYRTLRQRYNEL